MTLQERRDSDNFIKKELLRRDHTNHIERRQGLMKVKKSKT